MDKDQYVLAVGNPFDGIVIYGPFDTQDDAAEAANYFAADWWIVKLQSVGN